MVEVFERYSAAGWTMEVGTEVLNLSMVCTSGGEGEVVVLSKSSTMETSSDANSRVLQRIGHVQFSS